MEKVCLLTEIMHNRVEQEENYAREVLKEQLEEGWEGLTTEVSEICQLVGLPDACYEYIHRKAVVDAIEIHHMKEVKEQMEPLSKMQVLKLGDTRRMQPYMKTKSLANS